MLSIISDALRIASRTEGRHDNAEKRRRARLKAEQENTEYYRRWLKSSHSRW